MVIMEVEATRCCFVGGLGMVVLVVLVVVGPSGFEIDSA